MCCKGEAVGGCALNQTRSLDGSRQSSGPTPSRGLSSRSRARLCVWRKPNVKFTNFFTTSRTRHEEARIPHPRTFSRDAHFRRTHVATLPFVCFSFFFLCVWILFKIYTCVSQHFSDNHTLFHASISTALTARWLTLSEAMLWLFGSN